MLSCYGKMTFSRCWIFIRMNKQCLVSVWSCPLWLSSYDSFIYIFDEDYKKLFEYFFCKSLLKCVCSQFHIERVVYTGQHDRKPWESGSLHTLWFLGLFYETNSCMLVLFPSGAFFYCSVLMWLCAGHPLSGKFERLKAVSSSGEKILRVI